MSHTAKHQRARQAASTAAVAACVLLLAGCALIPGGGKKAAPTTAPPKASAGATTTTEPDSSGRPSLAELKPGKWGDAETPPGSFEAEGFTVFQGKLWVAGGFNEARQVVKDVWIFDPGTETWEAGPKLPVRMTHVTLGATNDKLLAIGGFTFDTPGTAVDTVFELDGEGGKWTKGPKLPVRMGAAAAAYDGERLVLGGGVLQSGRPTDSVYIFEDDHWRKLGDRLSKAREHLAADSDGKGSVYFIGGEQSVNNQKTEFARVDVVKGNKVAKIGDLPISRGAAAGFWLPPATACAVGGRNSDGRPVGAVDCVSADGKRVSLPSLPEPRFGLAAALFEDRLYAFGGFTADKVASDEATKLSLTGD